MLAVQQLKNFLESMAEAMMTQQTDALEHAHSCWLQVIRVLQLLLESSRGLFIKHEAAAKYLRSFGAHNAEVEEFWLPRINLQLYTLWEAEVSQISWQCVVVP